MCKFLTTKVHKSQHWMCHWFSQSFFTVRVSYVYTYFTHNLRTIRVRYCGRERTCPCTFVPHSFYWNYQWKKHLHFANWFSLLLTDLGQFRFQNVLYCSCLCAACFVEGGLHDRCSTVKSTELIASYDTIRYDTIGEFNVDSKAEYSA